MEEQKKRKVATQKAIAQFREQYSEVTDERLAEMVEEMYPKKFDSVELGIEIMKELYRESLPLDEENFKAMLLKWDEKGMLKGRDLESRRQFQIEYEITQKKDRLIKQIYKDATERTVYLSQYPDYSGDVKERLTKLAETRGKTLAQVLSSLLNVEAMYQTSDDAIVQRNYLTFHCYAEPNGDVIFTKTRRTLADYDENGNPIKRDTQPQQDTKKSWLVVLALLAFIIILFALLFRMSNPLEL